MLWESSMERIRPRCKYTFVNIQATGFISIQDFNDFIQCLIEEESKLIPLRRSFKSHARRNDLIAMLRVPTYFNFEKYYFVDVLCKLSHDVLETDFLSEHISNMKNIMKQSDG